MTGCVYVSFMSTLKSPELRLTIMSVCFNSAFQINFANGCFNLVVGILKHFFLSILAVGPAKPSNQVLTN